MASNATSEPSAAEVSTLSTYLSRYLEAEHLSFRQAARRSGLPAATINALVTRPGGFVRASTRAGLVKLGLDRDLVDVLTAQQAGWSAHPMTEDELKLLKWYRNLDAQQRKRLNGRVGRDLQAS